MKAIRTFPVAGWLLLAVTWIAGAQNREPFPWRSDLDLARLEALRDNKPILLVFRCEP